MAAPAKMLRPKPIRPRLLSTGRYLLDNGRYIDTPDRNYYRAYVEQVDAGWQTRYFHGSEFLVLLLDDRKREAYVGAWAVLQKSLTWSWLTGSDCEAMHRSAVVADAGLRIDQELSRLDEVRS